MAYDRKDAYYQRAKAAGYRSRAAYKLLELARRHPLIRRGDRVLDLGSWPGGWLQVAGQLVGPRGVVVGVDVRPVDPFAGRVSAVVGDVRDEETLRELERRLGGPADVILSDMAPKLTGVRARDRAAEAELTQVALDVATRLLREHGRMIMKLFMGADTEQLMAEARRMFRNVKLTRPTASRKGSAEMYLLATDFRAASGPAQ